MQLTLQEREKRRIERELRQIAFASAADYAEVQECPDDEGRRLRVLPTVGMSKGRLAALAALKEGKSGVEVKLKDSLKALELLCKLHGLLTPDKKSSGADCLGELLEGLRELDTPPEEDDDDL